MEAQKALPEVAEELWNYLLEDKLQRLQTKDQKRLRDILNYDTFQESLNGLLVKHKSKQPVRFLEAIKPAIEGLSTFSHALNSINQVNPFTSLGWGVAQLLLEVGTCHIFVHSYFAETFAERTPLVQDVVTHRGQSRRLHKNPATM